MAFIEDIVTQLRRLELALNAALLRLQRAQDAEALHDLRVSLRRIRSLLRPLRGCPGATRLDRAAAELGKLTTPLRDLEVLIAELARHRLFWQANVRQSNLQARCRQLLANPQLADFPSLLHAWPRRFRRTARRPAKHRLSRRLQRQQQQLRRALADTGYDRHRLRLLVKRLRYAAEAYPQRLPLSPGATASLKAAQSALGDWHDREVWCQQAEHQPDLWPLLPLWQSEQRQALTRAETTLAALSPALAAKTGGASRS
ncbi:metal-chelation protein CHAD [Serratia marcescens]|uniref:Metal-chelation protein CHAD n=1 Tax=Serratia marcescens TaxID=615 RepID=A0A1Q4NWN0_SERMA|nr:CHAD domain-containing protein [Serratia marcescens]OKB65302.1 metal-chelation protein CHAD [Serratia marcescens]